MRNPISSKTIRWMAILLLIASTVIPSHASKTFIGTNGLLAAAVDFDVIGGQLQVTLNNTSLADVTAPTAGGAILTGVFFDLTPTTTLTPVSALLGLGSVVYFGPSGGGNVGGEWGYASGLVGAPGNTGLGVSSSGLGLFGQSNFNGPNLQGPTALDGLQYGITSLGDNMTTGNAAVTGQFALIKNSVVFTLSGNPTFTTIDDYTISNVSFQYGTSLLEPNVPGILTTNNIPEPSTMSLCGLMLAFQIFRLRRDNKSDSIA
jgi:hypothetical protein